MLAHGIQLNCMAATKASRKMNEEIAQRFNTIEKLILDLKSTLTSKYEEIDKRLEKVIDSQNFISSESNFTSISF